MKRLHANVGSRNPALEQRPEVLQAVSVYAAIYVLSRVVNDLMSVFTCQSFVGHEGIGIESRASSNVLAYFLLQYLAAAIRNHAGADLATTLQDSDHCGFVLPASAGNPALTFTNVHVPCFATDESLIDFDLAVQFGTEELISHSKANPMQHEPCRLLGNLHVTRNLVARDAVLAIGDHPSCGKPLVQGNRRIFHDGADLDGELTLWVMLRARPSQALLAEFHGRATASRADDLAVRPSADREIVDAVIRIREVDDCFLQALGFGHGLVLHDSNNTEITWSGQVYSCPNLRMDEGCFCMFSTRISNARVVAHFDTQNGCLFGRSPFDKLRACSRPAGKNAGLRDDAKRITALNLRLRHHLCSNSSRAECSNGYNRWFSIHLYYSL